MMFIIILWIQFILRILAILFFTICLVGPRVLKNAHSKDATNIIKSSQAGKKKVMG